MCILQSLIIIWLSVCENESYFVVQDVVIRTVLAMFL